MGKFMQLIEICGQQTCEQVLKRVGHKEHIFFGWLRDNPDATKNEIERKSHEIAGTLDEYELTKNKRFHVIQAYRNDVDTQVSGFGSFSEIMILSTDLMCSALEIAGEMSEYADTKGQNIMCCFSVFKDVLQKLGIAWNEAEMGRADVSQMSAAEVIALIVCMTWANRLSPGSIEPYLQDGTIMKWLDRLEELDVYS